MMDSDNRQAASEPRKLKALIILTVLGLSVSALAWLLQLFWA